MFTSFKQESCIILFSENHTIDLTVGLTGTKLIKKFNFNKKKFKNRHASETPRGFGKSQQEAFKKQEAFEIFYMSQLGYFKQIFDRSARSFNLRISSSHRI